MKRTFATIATLITLLSASDASAHFQLLYTPQINVQKAGDLPLKLLFWHPMENGHVMKMEKPEEFFSVYDGQKTDLMPTLRPMTFSGLTNANTGYDASAKLKRNGDYALVVKPVPYFEESEDIFIQQITKVVLNKGGVPKDWHQPLGIETEIVPLIKPYGTVVGSTFSGIVLSEGKPAANIEIEVEYMTAEPDMALNKPVTDNSLSVPGGTITLLSDQNGQFTFGIPKAGYWGFAALGSGPAKEYKGKELSQDAVLWIKAHELGD